MARPIIGEVWSFPDGLGGDVSRIGQCTGFVVPTAGGEWLEVFFGAPCVPGANGAWVSRYAGAWPPDGASLLRPCAESANEREAISTSAPPEGEAPPEPPDYTPPEPVPDEAIAVLVAATVVQQCSDTAEVNVLKGLRHRLELTVASCMLSMAAPPTAHETVVLMVVQDAQGGRLVEWPERFRWPGGQAPTLSTEAGAVDVVRADWDGAHFLATVVLGYREE
jgi:hypothetical protein